MKKLGYYLLPITLLCIPLLMVGYQMSAHGYSWSEAVLAVRSAGKNQTKFQELKYSERLFHRIQPGMSGKEVYEMLGTPLERNMPADTLWKYSVNIGGTGFYHERSLIMEKGKVAAVICRFAHAEEP
jgi:hypothetical protein